MKSTNADRMNLPIRQSLLEELRWRNEFSRMVANCCRNRIGSRIAGLRLELAHSFQNYLSPQRMGAITMIAISILCALLICLFRFDLEDAASPG